MPPRDAACGATAPLPATRMPADRTSRYRAPGTPLFGATSAQAMPSVLSKLLLACAMLPRMEHGRVLVVEDDTHVRDAVARALRFEGYDVHTAVDGNDGLLRIDELAPDAVVLDVLMPGTDGLAVCRILRERGNHTPVLMLTARHEVSDRVAGLDAGADDYLVKPFALDELLARLRALLRRASITDGDSTLTVADLVLDPMRRQA